MLNFKGSYGSITDNTVDSDQMDNTVQIGQYRCVQSFWPTMQISFLRAYYKTRNTGTRNNRTQNTGGTAEHPGIVAEQRNTNITPAEQPGTTEPCTVKKNCI